MAERERILVAALLHERLCCSAYVGVDGFALFQSRHPRETQIWLGHADAVLAMLAPSLPLSAPERSTIEARWPWRGTKGADYDVTNPNDVIARLLLALPAETP